MTIFVSNNHNVEVWQWYGTDGIDVLDAATWAGVGILMFGYGGNDTLRGGAGDDDLRGGDDNDTLEGNGGDDSLDWNDPGQAAGSDILNGGTGRNSVRGGTGINQLIVQGTAATDEVNFNNTSVTLNSESTSFTEIQSITFISVGGNDNYSFDNGFSVPLVVTGSSPRVQANRVGLEIRGSFSDPGDGQTWTGLECSDNFL